MTENSRLGDTIDSYRLVRVLGTGSTSVVYLGQHLDDAQAVVAVKVLTLGDGAKPADQATFHLRFLQEARAVSKLRHEHILPVLSYGDAGGVTYMVMPVASRGTLGGLLATHKGELPLSEIAEYLRQVGSALDFAHQQGVVHRDVKPSNILLDERGQVYLTDFGIAHLFDAGGNALTRIYGLGTSSLTRTGEVLGTPYYMAPEQIKSEPIGPATDIYALGVVAYQLVTRQLPFSGDTPLAVAMQHLQEAPCPPALLRQDLPESAQAAMLRALAKQPSDRFPSAGAFAQAFADGLRGVDPREASMSASATQPMALPLSMSDATDTSTSDLRALLPSGPQSSSAPSAPATSDSPRSETTTMQDLVGATVGSYHLDALLEVGDLGAIFAAQSETGTARYRLRILPVGSEQSPEARSLSLARFQQQARDAAALQHPSILPLVDYGSFRGMPYLVTPPAPGLSLAVHLAQGGPLDLHTAGRYLDQIAAALEYVHEHGLLHRNLTADCVFLDQSGQVVVADLEVRRLLELSGHLAPDGSSSGLTPEQMRGDPVGTYTDVYALGAVLYQMLTAHSLYGGATREEIAQQHMHATVPPLRRWRGGLPAGLESILARALAKEPDQRFRHPSELSSAYRQLVARQSGVVPFVVAPAPSVSRVRQSDRPAMADTQTVDVRSTGSGSAPKEITPLHAAPSAPPAELPPQPEPSSGAASKWMLPAFVRGRPFQNALFLVLVFVLIGGTTAMLNGYPARFFSHPVAPAGAKGDAFFLDDPSGSPGHTDAVRLDVTGLAAAPSGFEYDAWLTNEQSERFLALGTLTPQGKNFVLTYPGRGGAAGTNLLGAGDKLEITLERGPVQAPAGTIVLVGAFPPQAFVHVQHLLVAFPDTPNHVGFLEGLLDQAQQLEDQGLRLRDDAQGHDTLAIQCRAQSIVDIIEGSQGPNYQHLSGACASRDFAEAGDGFGLLHNGNNTGYLDGVADHAALAAQAPDATALIKTHAQHVQIAVSNIKGWLQTIDQDAVNLIKNPGDLSHVDEIVSLSDHALNGQNLDADETIDPVPGEAGAKTAYEHGQLLATLTLTSST